MAPGIPQIMLQAPPMDEVVQRVVAGVMVAGLLPSWATHPTPQGTPSKGAGQGTPARVGGNTMAGVGQGKKRGTPSWTSRLATNHKSGVISLNMWKLMNIYSIVV